MHDIDQVSYKAVNQGNFNFFKNEKDFFAPMGFEPAALDLRI